MDVPYRLFQLSPSGSFANPNLIIIHENPNTPNCFPRNKPKTIPRVILFKTELNVKPSRDTPAFAKAKTGIIRNATHGCSICSQVLKGEGESAVLPFKGMANARATPASVACTPDFSTQIHNIIPNIT